MKINITNFLALQIVVLIGGNFTSSNCYCMQNTNDKVLLGRNEIDIDENGNVIENEKFLLQNNSIENIYWKLFNDVTKDENFTKYVPFINKLQDFYFEVCCFFHNTSFFPNEKVGEEVVERTALNNLFNEFFTLNIEEITLKQFALYWENKVSAMFINTMKNIQNIIKNNDQNNEKKIQDEVMKVIMQNLKLILDTVARIMYNKNYIFKLYNIEKDKKYNIYYFIRDVSYKLYKMKEHNIYNKYAPNSYEYRVFDIYYSNWKQYDEISKKFDDYYNEFMSIRDSFYGDYKEFLGKQKYYRIFSNIGTKLFSECLNCIKYKPREYWDIINTEEDISAMLIFHENCKLIFNTLYDIGENILSEKFKKLNILFSQDELKQYTNKICIEGDKQISIGEILMCLANEIMINMTENVMNKIHRGANILGTISDIGIKYNKEILNDIIKLLSHYCGFLSKSNRKPVKTELKKISKYIEMLNDINEILNNLKMENINDKISLDRDENGNIIENKKLLLSNHALYLEYVDLLHNVKKDKNFTKYVPFIKQLENICFDVKDFFRAYDISEKQKQMKKEDLIVDRISLNKILNGFITLNIKKITPKQFAYYWNNKILSIFINTIKNIQNIIKNNNQNNEENIQHEVMKVIMQNLELILDTVVSLVNNKPENGIFYLYNKELEKFDTTTYMTGISRALHEMNKYNIFKKYYNKYATKYHIFDIYYDKWETYDTIREQFMKDYNEFYNEKYENEKENKLFDKQNLCDICETLFLKIIDFVKYNPYDKKIDTNVLSDFYKNCKPIFNVIYDIGENILYGKLNEMNMLISQNDLIKYKYTNEIHIGEDEQISLGKILICFANTIINEVIHVAHEIEKEDYVYPESNINDDVLGGINMIEKIVNEVKKLLLDYSHHLQQNDKNLIDIELEKISENTKALTDLINKYKLNKNPD